jgi:predicted nucleotidyltransferase
MAPATHQPPLHSVHGIDMLLQGVLAQFPQLELAVLFGSVARGQAHAHSDLDLAVQAPHPLTAPAKQALIEALAAATGRPVDLVDLKVVGEPLLGQILKHGRRLLGSDTAYARLTYQHLLDQADFMPYRNRILAERRAAWLA